MHPREILFISLLFSTAAFATSTDAVQVCTIPLPVFENTQINRMILGTKHIYLKVGGKTYGTPHTARGTYMGGDAYLYSEDLYARNPELRRGEKCFGVNRPKKVSDERFASKLACITEKFTMPYQSTDPDLSRTWYPVFDYHGLYNNCGSMADFIITCGGGKFKKFINFSVGNKVPLTKPAKIVSMIDSSDVQMSTYGDICQKALAECDSQSAETD
jgi:hypothetical protein